MTAFTLKLENLKIVSGLVGRQVCVIVCEYCVYFVIRGDVEIAVERVYLVIGWRLVLCVLFVIEC